jgi:hypothetical protein
MVFGAENEKARPRLAHLVFQDGRGPPLTHHEITPRALVNLVPQRLLQAFPDRVKGCCSKCRVGGGPHIRSRTPAVPCRMHQSAGHTRHGRNAQPELSRARGSW